MPDQRGAMADALRAADGTAYESHGQGPAVVLVHGLGLRRDMWQWLRPALLPRFHVVAYDLYGHGESPDPAHYPDLALFSAQIAGLLDELDIGRCALVGFSLGGLIARRFALDWPDRLSALAILNSPHDRSPAERAAVLKRVELARAEGPAATVDAAMERWFTEEFRRRDPATIALVRRWVRANRKEAYPEIYRVFAEGDAELVETVAAIHSPTLVMTAEQDSGSSPDMARRMAAAIPEARAVILPRLRHMGLVEDPGAFNEPLVSFLAEALAEP